MATVTERFTDYFNRPAAQKAARSIGDGAEIELRIVNSDNTVLETFTFTKDQGKNQIRPHPAKDPQLLFTLTPQAAESILADPAEDVGSIGIHIAKFIISPDTNKRVTVKFKAGFFTLFSKGYFGVLSAGGSGFAGFLASCGLNGMGAIKSVLKKARGE